MITTVDSEVMSLCTLRLYSSWCYHKNYFKVLCNSVLTYTKNIKLESFSSVPIILMFIEYNRCHVAASYNNVSFLDILVVSKAITNENQTSRRI